MNFNNVSNLIVLVECIHASEDSVTNITLNDQFFSTYFLVAVSFTRKSAAQYDY